MSIASKSALETGTDLKEKTESPHADVDIERRATCDHGNATHDLIADHGSG